MNTLVLILNRESPWSPELWARQSGGKPNVDGQVMIEEPSGWLSVVREDSVLDEYEEGEMKAISAVLPEPVLFLLEWKGSELIESLLSAVPSDCAALIDNDHGLLISIHEVRGLPLKLWARADKLRNSSPKGRS